MEGAANHIGNIQPRAVSRRLFFTAALTRCAERLEANQPALSRWLWASIAVAGGLGAGAGTLRAQSINVDIDVTTGAGASVPTLAFGGAANAPGRWNSVPPTGAGPFQMLLLNGALSSVKISRTGMAASFASNNAATAGEYERLLDDIQNIGNPNPSNNPGSTLTIDGLAPGDYELYTYAIAPDSSVLRSIVTVTPSPDPPQTVGGAMPTNALTINVTHAKHRFSITEQSPTVTLNVRGGTASPGSLNGFQIKQVKPGRLYVQQGMSNGDGRAWGSAYGDIASALAQWDTMTGFAGGAGEPEIWVSRGTYLPTSVSSGDRNASFVFPAGRKLTGNFRGTAFGNGGETLRTQRQPGLPAGTILSGDIGTLNVATDNSRQVLKIIGPVTLDGFTIEGGNDDSGAGGGVSVLGSAKLVGVTVRNCTSKGGGAGVRVLEGGTLEFREGVFENCQSQTGAAAIDATQGASAVSVYSTRVLRCSGVGDGSLISGAGAVDVINSALVAGHCEGAAVLAAHACRVISCTIYGNTVIDGAVIDGGAGSVLANSIVWRNVDDSLQARPAAGAGVDVRYCCVQGGSIGEGNVDMVPRLRSPTGSDGVLGTLDDDYSPLAGSCAIDSADDLFFNQIAPLETKDLLGNARLVVIAGSKQGLGPNKPMDRGAVEAQAKYCAGDFNRTGGVTVSDVFDFLSAWFNASARADVNESGSVGVDDLFEFISRWFEAC